MAIELKFYKGRRSLDTHDHYEVEDKEIDDIFNNLTYLRVDIRKKIDELKPLCDEAEDVANETNKKFWELDGQPEPDEDIDPEAYAKWHREYEEAEEAYDEARMKYDALSEMKENLEDLLDKLGE